MGNEDHSVCVRNDSPGDDGRSDACFYGRFVTHSGTWERNNAGTFILTLVQATVVEHSIYSGRDSEFGVWTAKQKSWLKKQEMPRHGIELENIRVKLEVSGAQVSLQRLPR